MTDSAPIILRIPLHGYLVRNHDPLDPPNAYTAERVWAQRLSIDRARILSVLRYDGAAQFGDIVEYKGEDFVSMVERSSLTMHRVYGGMTSPVDAKALMEKLREQHLYIEVWSWTMAKEPPEPTPLRAGLMVSDPHIALAALAGRQLYYPTLLAAAGDELGARRHAREVKRAA